MNTSYPLRYGAILVLVITACRHPVPEHGARFTLRDSGTTGLTVSNNLVSSAAFNMFRYLYFFNGSGIGAGDFNNDGLIDLFFASNQQRNTLYLNSGKLRFRDITEQAGVPDDHGWSTGVSVVDINHDGLLDIYVCRVSGYANLHGRNLLLVCDSITQSGIPVYSERARDYGLDFAGFSTQAAFLDFDHDGDLDMYLLNHAVHQDGSFAPRKSFIDTYDSLSGDRFYRNDDGYFRDITKEVHINSSKIGYGLGIAVSDLDLDGWPDIYVANDFHENDYLYINQRNGQFRDELTDRVMHTSQFSMGVDIADVNNDAWPEIISLDMLPYDPYILKRSLGDNEYDVFQQKQAAGYAPQFSRNNLQWNRGKAVFSDVGLYAGVSATDWSWAALWMDFDNDGLKDLFVSNGIPKRLNDIDYVNYFTDAGMAGRARENKLDKQETAIIDQFPEIKLPNKFFRNTGALRFEDIGQEVRGNPPSFSNGAIYADLDNDGDLDIVTSDIDGPALLYENNTNDDSARNYVDIILRGPNENPNATGARVVLFSAGDISIYEKSPVRGFLSSMEIPLHLGLQHIRVDSAFIVWPDASFQQFKIPAGSRHITLPYEEGLPPFNFDVLTKSLNENRWRVKDIARSAGLNFEHRENSFNEFNREPLLPRELSAEGPALAVGDGNGDGLDDVFFGSSKNQKGEVFLQKPDGTFYRSRQPDLENDSTFEDVGACWTDVNGDGFNDLVVASGGNEYYGNSEYQRPRLYLSGSNGRLTQLPDAFGNLLLQASCAAPCDFNGDGYVDLFIGARTVPFKYGETPRSYLLANDGTGHFTDVTDQYAKDLGKAGFVKDAVWTDLDGDGDLDLVLALEWDGILVYVNNSGSFERREITKEKGWWNFMLPLDVDGDGDIDLIAGNLGLNSRLKASAEHPVNMYYADFDGNGTKEQLLTYFLGGRELPFANKGELDRSLPILKKKFLYAGDFAKASLTDLVSAEKLKEARRYTADYFQSAVLLNDGKMNFTVKPLPWEAQLSPMNSAVPVDVNHDSLPDLFLVGNFYENNIQMGRNDADYGTVLINRGHGEFSVGNTGGLFIRGESRHVKQAMIRGKSCWVIARNNGKAILLAQE